MVCQKRQKMGKLNEETVAAEMVDRIIALEQKEEIGENTGKQNIIEGSEEVTTAEETGEVK